MFTHKVTRYRPLDIKNPFKDEADKAYADLLQGLTEETRFWRNIIGIGSLFLFAIALIFFIYALSLQKTVPVLVNIMEHGEPQYLGEVRQSGAARVPEAAVQFQVRDFITKLRSIPADPQVLFNDIEACYAMVTVRCEKIMTDELRAASPFDMVGKTRRQIRVESVIKSTGSTYQIDWFEITSGEAQSGKQTRMRALVTTKLLPTSEKTIQKNPLGIYIESYEMTSI